MTKLHPDATHDPRPWENEHGATDLNGFLAAYELNEVDLWQIDVGHLVNLLEELIERRGQL